MNANAKNLPEFKALIERYETITLEEITEAWDEEAQATGDHDVAKELTGFGSRQTCTLCAAAKNNGGLVDCGECVYGEAMFGLSCTFHQTYDNIVSAGNASALLSAYRARAVYMRTILKEIDHA